MRVVELENGKEVGEHCSCDSSLTFIMTAKALKVVVHEIAVATLTPDVMSVLEPVARLSALVNSDTEELSSDVTKVSISSWVRHDVICVGERAVSVWKGCVAFGLTGGRGRARNTDSTNLPKIAVCSICVVLG